MTWQEAAPFVAGAQLLTVAWWAREALARLPGRIVKVLVLQQPSLFASIPGPCSGQGIVCRGPDGLGQAYCATHLQRYSGVSSQPSICEVCLGAGEHDLFGGGAVLGPCDACRPEEYARWRAGLSLR